MRKCVCIAASLLLLVLTAMADDLSDANALFQKQDWSNAAKAYRALTQAHPESGLAWFRLGFSLHQTGDYAGALDAYKHAEAANFPAKMQLSWRMARAYARVGDKDKALAELEQLASNGIMQLQSLDSEADLASVRGDVRYTKVRDQVAHNAMPCADSAENHQFDFWIGEWNVDAGGQPVGTSSIQQILGQCVILENWTGASGYTGKSFNIYDKGTKKWRQFWVDAVGGLIVFEGEYADNKLVLFADALQPDGTHAKRRLTFFNLGPGHVRQFSEQTKDGGKTWTTEYDFNYVKKPS